MSYPRCFFFAFSPLPLRVFFVSNHFALRNFIGRTRIGSAFGGLGPPGRTQPTTWIENYRENKMKKKVSGFTSSYNHKPDIVRGQVARHMSVRRKRFV